MSATYKLFLVCFTTCILHANLSYCADDMSIINMTCSGRKIPKDIENTEIYLSWQVKTKKRNFNQIAYQILVSDVYLDMKNDIGGIWNSGRIKDDRSVQIAYNGKELFPTKMYYWKVRIWDNSGHISEWSKISYWKTALFKKDDWLGAKWIAHDIMPLSETIVPAIHGLGDAKKQTYTKKILPMFRKEFGVDKSIGSAMIYISGLGQFDLSMNGKKVGDHFLDPGWTKYDKTAQYVTFDVTDRINKGKNVLGVMLGNGFY